MPSDIAPRAAFLMDNLGGNHLHVVLYDLDRYGLCLLAPISSVKAGRSYDPACILHNTEHDFLRCLSFVVYERLYQPRSEHTQRMIQQKLYHLKDPVTQELFDRIVDGLFRSENTRARIIGDARRAGLRERCQLLAKRT